MTKAIRAGSPLDLAIRAVGTASGLAERLGISQQAVSKWKIKGEIPIQRLPEVARASGVPLKLLLPAEFSEARNTGA